MTLPLRSIALSSIDAKSWPELFAEVGDGMKG
jgi:hypothetical protein